MYRYTQQINHRKSLFHYRHTKYLKRLGVTLHYQIIQAWIVYRIKHRKMMTMIKASLFGTICKKKTREWIRVVDEELFLPKEKLTAAAEPKSRGIRANSAHLRMIVAKVNMMRANKIVCHCERVATCPLEMIHLHSAYLARFQETDYTIYPFRIDTLFNILFSLFFLKKKYTINYIYKFVLLLHCGRMEGYFLLV
ncbi:hypothetical protein BD408DRAFT_110501 [Parasitella parasitica]|nr:hypothetical protein BD408DRAFT_110501 [Parasitella parasitica]